MKKFSLKFMTRAIILNKINSALALIDDNKVEEALPALLEVKDLIVETRFWPILKNILPILMNLLEKEKDYQKLCVYYLLKNSLYIHSNNYDLEFLELSEFLNRIPETHVTVTDTYANVLPLVCELNYFPNQVYIGTRPHLICKLMTHFSQAIHINDISIEFINNTSRVHSISLGEFTFQPRGFQKKILDYDADPATTIERVNAVTYIIGNGVFRIEKNFDAEILFISQSTDDKSVTENATFHTQFQLFNNNYIPSNRPVIGVDEYASAELSITNTSNITVTIVEISSLNSEVKCTHLPLELFPGEQYSFTAIIRKECFPCFTVNYTTELSDIPRIFEFSASEVKVVDRLIKADLESPSKATLNQPFDAKLTIEITDNSPYAHIFIEISPSTNFFVNGPSRKSFFLFPNQKKEIIMTFLPLNAGPLMLPTIYVHNISLRENNPKIFLHPIIVSY